MRSRDTAEETSVHAVPAPSPTLDFAKEPTAGSEPRPKVGRPRSQVSPEEVLDLLNSGLSLRKAARKLNIGLSTAGRLRDAAVLASQNRGNPSQNPPSRQADETTLGGATDALEPPLDAIGERPGDNPEHDGVPAPRIRTVKVRRMSPRAASYDQWPRQIDGSSPGACPQCGSSRWRISLAGTCVCESCHPVRIY